jgi:uracil-DNA glycosylase
MIQISQAIRQQLEMDRLMGLTFVPIARDRLAAGIPQPPTRESAPESEGARAPMVSAERPVQRYSSDEKIQRLRVLDETQVKGCQKCSLHTTRTQTVFGQGSSDARLVFVGEAPGYEEDQQGLAFVGPAGQLLTRMIEAGMKLKREDVFICNVLKCRPPKNRDPSADEILACSPYLRAQLEIIQPEVIVSLGSPATKTLLNTAESIGKLRGRWHEYYLSGTTGVGPSIPLMPTYHPAYLLRNENEKKKSWADLQMVMARLGLPLPK